jgi:hypothetical protein
MKLIRLQSMYTMTPMYHMYEDKYIEKFKRVMRHIKFISMNREFLMDALRSARSCSGWSPCTP